MRRRHAPPPAHPFNIYIFKQHAPSIVGRRQTIRLEPSLPKINQVYPSTTDPAPSIKPHREHLIRRARTYCQ